MLLYLINAYKDKDNNNIIYITTDISTFEINTKTFSVKQTNLPENVEELAIEILCTKKIYRERYYAIEVYAEKNIYLILHYDPYSMTVKIPVISLNEKDILNTLENLTQTQ